MGIGKELASLLDGNVPYSLVRGDRDQTERFSKYLVNDNYIDQVDGFYSHVDVTSSYDTITVGDDKYLFLNLNYCPSTEEIEWASEVVEAHSEHKVIVNTHIYLCTCGSDPMRLSNGINCENCIDGLSIDSSVLWDNFVSQHRNIMIVLCSHDANSDITVKQDKGVHGNTVTQIFTNPMTIDEHIKPSGMIAMMYFYPETNEVTVEYYSTIEKKYFKESNCFTFSLGSGHNETESDIGSSGKVTSDELDFISASSFPVLETGTTLLLIEGENECIYAIDGKAMYYSEKYGAHIAVVSDVVAELTSELASAITSSPGTAEPVDYSGDINGDGCVGASDAAIVSEMLLSYSTDHVIEGITDIMRLRADVYDGNDRCVTLDDALWILYASVGLTFDPTGEGQVYIQ